MGFNALAVLTNDPKHLTSNLNCLPFNLVYLCDGDRAGKVLGKLAKNVLFMPDGEDPGSMTDDQLLEVVSDYL